MPRPLRPALALGLALELCACFRGLDAIGGEPATQASIHLQIQDQRGAIWPAEGAPRAPVFVLQFADGAPDEAASHVSLLRGAASEELLSDLRSAQRRATTEARRLTLATTRAGRSLLAQPAHPLEPGARYTLVWAEAGASLAFPLVVSRGPAAGARLAHSLPAALETQVPPNLARALLRFDGYLTGDVQQSVHLLDGAGEVAAALRSAACAELGLGPGDCVSLTPDAELRPGERYRLSIAAGLRDATGAALAARDIPFQTAGERDTRAPAWLALDCARDELASGPVCVLLSDRRVQVRARSDENGLLTLAGDGALAASPGSSGDYALELALARPLSALLQLDDLAGNTAQITLALAPLLDLAPIAIDELRVDPLGAEASQEYVELLNFGDAPMSIADFSLSDDAFAAGQRIEGRPTLAAGERALVVPAGFDAGDARDQAPAAGVRLLRLAGALPLRNEGSALYLRDARGRRVSAAPAIAPEQPGQCSARLREADPRSGASATFALDPAGGCTPGYATDWTAETVPAP